MLNLNQRIEALPINPNTKAEKIALEFAKILEQKGLKCVKYSTGMNCGAWSLDIYLIPENEEKPVRQKRCTGEHIISLKYGYYVSGTDNQLIYKIQKYMENNQ